MFTKQKRHEVDMCNGPLFPKIITFFIPVMLSNMLQLVYNAADQLIVGRFAGSRALASVGATASLVNLIVCFLTGLSVGASSVIARHFGANNQRSLTRAAHTSVMISIIGGRHPAPPQRQVSLLSSPWPCVFPYQADQEYRRDKSFLREWHLLNSCE